MAQLGLWATIKDWIGGVGFAIYLWSQSLTEEEYFDLLERDAEHRRVPDPAEQGWVQCPNCKHVHPEVVLHCDICGAFIPTPNRSAGR